MIRGCPRSQWDALYPPLPLVTNLQGAVIVYGGWRKIGANQKSAMKQWQMAERKIDKP